MSHSHKKRADQIMKAQYKAGWDAGVEATFKVIYPCILIAAKQAFGFGTERGLRLLRRVDDVVCSGQYIDSQEAIDEVLAKYKIRLKFSTSAEDDDPFDLGMIEEA